MRLPPLTLERLGLPVCRLPELRVVRGAMETAVLVGRTAMGGMIATVRVVTVGHRIAAVVIAMAVRLERRKVHLLAVRREGAMETAVPITGATTGRGEIVIATINAGLRSFRRHRARSQQIPIVRLPHLVRCASSLRARARARRKIRSDGLLVLRRDR